MASAAQIEANRRNAQRSTGPKTDEGKARVRRNAFKHGMTARTIMPVLPQEDPKELEDRTQQAITAMKPRNPLELDLVRRAVRLSGEIDRAERVGTAHLAHRVRMATRSGPETVSAEAQEGSRTRQQAVFSSRIGPGYRVSADDDPAVIVRRLEESAEGCRWMLARWAELLNVLDRKAAWRDPEMIRFVGLQGKRSIERTSTRNSIPSSMPSMRSATASATSSGRTTEMGCRWAIKAVSSLCPIARSPRRPAMRPRR